MISQCRLSSFLLFLKFVDSVILLASIILYVGVHGKNDVHVTTVQRNLLRQRDAESLASIYPTMRALSTANTNGRRHMSDSRVYPYSAVGILRWNTSTCTATLVASKIVLTAADCVLDSEGEVRISFPSTFSFTLLQAATLITASVIRVHKQSDFWTQWTRNLYVLVELDAELGDVNGALLLPPPNTFAQDHPMKVQLVDYGCNDETSECFQRCDIYFSTNSNDPEYLLRHDCDVSPKRSLGSPMLIRSTVMDTYIVGIYTKSIVDDTDDEMPTGSYNGAYHQGILGSFVQPHLSSLVQQEETFTSSTSRESSGTSLSSTSSSDDDLNSESSSQGQMNLINGGSGAERDSSSASTESSATSSQNGIAPTAAYTCIGLVCAAWLVIILAVVRKIRANYHKAFTTS
ncbi:v8-like glu-specific endopeptidase [Plasmopara halstedii]|uniref:V8-like glu-specific endopeptidase n=1 Tax=Plasmopara halstedii TaxID=4781 RepID=A0A0P1B436_PLAHL|nr:v8-like glu-specific endopeptidase [Plasmopara halstedii]CEG48866.1 v8-like glu-specific endopeptidase [Plasmopara halstedii]|eukprot:XP_024585235.1 v8-like glu-specific endopeptidase [Plasmopara halstedii]